MEFHPLDTCSREQKNWIVKLLERKEKVKTLPGRERRQIEGILHYIDRARRAQASPESYSKKSSEVVCGAIVCGEPIQRLLSLHPLNATPEMVEMFKAQAYRNHNGPINMRAVFLYLKECNELEAVAHMGSAKGHGRQTICKGELHGD